jgi:uncharacterized membrane protein
MKLLFKYIFAIMYLAASVPLFILLLLYSLWVWNLDKFVEGFENICDSFPFD